MATPRQIQSARDNAKRSTGPKTPAGKAASSLNALKHGLAATHPTALPGESRDAFQAMLDDYARQFKPRNLMERDLLYQLAVAAWQLERSWKIETALLHMQMARNEAALNAEFDDADASVRIAAAFEKSAGQLQLLLRYRAAQERAYHRALRALLNLRPHNVLAGNPRLYESHEERYARAVAETHRREAETLPPLAAPSALEPAARAGCETNRISHNPTEISGQEAHEDAPDLRRDPEVQYTRLFTP
jgi:hypothetical protein